MKKTMLKALTGMMMLAAVALTFSACGGSDDSPADNSGGGQGGQGGSISINGTTFAVSNAYYYVNPENATTSRYFILLYNCDYFAAVQNRDANMLPETIASITIAYEAPAGSETPPTGDFSEFVVLTSSIQKAALISGSDDHGIQYSAEATASGNSTYNNHGSKLIIQKNGNSYTVKAGELNYSNPFAGNDQTLYRGSAFSITCTPSKVPEGYYSVH